MLGKIAGALIGERIAGRNRGAKGAILGVVAETVVRKVVPTIAAIAIQNHTRFFRKTLIYPGSIANSSIRSEPAMNHGLNPL